MSTLRLSNIGAIFRRELQSSFNSPVAYVVIVVFLAIIGWFFTSNLFLNNTASLRIVFELVPLVFLFFAPAVTMRLIAEEKKSGTFELLATRPIRDIEIVLGKFLAAWTLLAAALAPTLLYLITLEAIGSPDAGPVVTGYLGLLLMGGVYIAVGVFASSLTENQIVAFIIGFLIMLKLRRIDYPDGKIFMIYLMLASAFRFAVEFLRLQPKFLFGLSEAQLIAIALFVVGFAGMKYVDWKRGRATATA